MIFGATLLAITLLYLRTLFAFTFGTITGLSPSAIAWFLRIIGLTSMIYACYNTFTDTIKWSTAPSDAREFGSATVLWGGLRLLISRATLSTTLRHGLGPNSNRPLSLPKTR